MKHALATVLALAGSAWGSPHVRSGGFRADAAATAGFEADPAMGAAADAVAAFTARTADPAATREELGRLHAHALARMADINLAVDAPNANGSQLPFGFKLPVHGRYCGPGHTDRSLGRGIDPVDECCRSHDIAYGKRYLDCPADAAMLRCLDAIADSTCTGACARGRWLVTKGFRYGVPCQCRNDGLMQPPRAAERCVAGARVGVWGIVRDILD